MMKYPHTIVLFLIGLMLAGCCPKAADSITIISFSDSHSQVEPTAVNANKNPNMGGYARRIGLINETRKQDNNLLVFDSGDFVQGTPYFNFFKGRVEVDALNRMGCDASTLGNHEFDNGLDSLAMLIRMANFPVVVANYDVAGTQLEGLVHPYVVIKRGGRRIGVIGVGVAPNDLIAKKNFGGIRYLDPLTVINETAQHLRQVERCDAVILLSHLGSDEGSKGYPEDYDMALIPQTHGLDAVLSAHTHHIHDERIADADGRMVALTQTGKSALRVGKMVLTFADKE